MPAFKLLVVLLTLIASISGWAQDSAPAEEDTASTASAAADEDEDAEDDVDLDDADLDLQTYDEDDDDFVPTEEVPADEAIPFPSDI